MNRHQSSGRTRRRRSEAELARVDLGPEAVELPSLFEDEVGDRMSLRDRSPRTRCLYRLTPRCRASGSAASNSSFANGMSPDPGVAVSAVAILRRAYEKDGKIAQPTVELGS